MKEAIYTVNIVYYISLRVQFHQTTQKKFLHYNGGA